MIWLPKMLKGFHKVHDVVMMPIPIQSSSQHHIERQD